MYAVIKTGGKQYRVTAGEKLKIERLPAEVGQEIVLDQVLLVGRWRSAQDGHAARCRGARSRPRCWRTGAATRSASSRCAAASTTARRQGHRQNYTEIEILGIA